MRDCPACKVPLHGYEEVCPSCGTKQIPTASSARMPYGAQWKPDQPKVNMLPFVAAFIIFAALLFFAMQSTWIGQLMREGKKAPDPMEKLTFTDARNFIDSELTKNLQAVGAHKSKLTWHVQGDTADAKPSAAKPDARTVDGPVELNVDTSLPQADLHKQVVEPIKPYMEKAKLYTLTMIDSKSHAHWTYNLAPPTSNPDPSGAGDQ